MTTIRVILKPVCELCDNPYQCLTNIMPCELCDEFIGSCISERECLNSWLDAAVEHLGGAVMEKSTNVRTETRM